MGRIDVFPLRKTFKCEPLDDPNVAPRFSSQRLNSLLFTY